ncbi:MAG: O-antigen ligase family protein, partial [Oscillospiraceae bacterium]|nr:O-antigen ligase family protein [Oscillospiraceae bacterium]
IAVTKSRWLAAALVADGALLLLYMALSDSRTGMVCLGVLSALGAMWALYPKRGDRRGLFRMLAAGAAALILGFLAVKLVQWAYNGTVIAVNRPELAVNRGYSMGGDLSNRRLDVWRSGLQIAMSRPLTGVSFTGAVPYARAHLPDTYILTNDLWVFNTFDSEPVNILVSQGIPGVILLAAWALLAFRRLLRGVNAVREERSPSLFLLTAVCAVLAVSALFQGTMFYQTTPDSFLFWSAFGALMHILPEGRKVGEENEICPV